MIAGKSLAPGKGSRLSFKRVEIVLYVNNPVMGLVASRVKGHPFVLIVDMHLPATNAHVDKLSHQPVGYRVELLTLLGLIISEHRHPIFRLKIRSVFRSITTQNMVRMA